MPGNAYLEAMPPDFLCYSSFLAYAWERIQARLCLLIFYVIRKLQETEFFAICFPGERTVRAYQEPEKQEKLSFVTG